jgi:hypothetical protein
MSFIEGRSNIQLDNFAGIRHLTAELCEGGEMLAYNNGDKENGFVICTRCGYAESELGVGEGQINPSKEFRKTYSFTSRTRHMLATRLGTSFPESSPKSYSRDRYPAN